MRLGATIHRYCGVRITNPDAYLAECRKYGFRAATCPDHNLGDGAQIREIRETFATEDVVIAEIGGWSNCLDPRTDERRNAVDTVSQALAVADEVGAVCCINLAGSFNSELMYAPHPDNFTADAFDAVVQWVKHVLREVKPQRTRLAIEAAPWTTIDSPEMYDRLLRAVDNAALAVHLDPFNFVTNARTYFRTGELVDRCFDLFGSQIVACHAKDLSQGDPKTVQIFEVPPGQGGFDYQRFLSRAEQLSPDLPIVIEHLDSEPEYADAAATIRAVAGEVGATV